MAYKNIVIWSPSWHPRLDGYLINGTQTPSNIYVSSTNHASVVDADAEAFVISQRLSDRTYVREDLEPLDYIASSSRWVLNTDTAPVCRIYGNFRSAHGVGSEAAFIAVFADYFEPASLSRLNGLSFLDDIAITTDASGNFETYALKGARIIFSCPPAGFAFAITVPDDDSIDIMDLDLEPVDLRRNS